MGLWTHIDVNFDWWLYSLINSSLLESKTQWGCIETCDRCDYCMLFYIFKSLTEKLPGLCHVIFGLITNFHCKSHTSVLILSDLLGDIIVNKDQHSVN